MDDSDPPVQESVRSLVAQAAGAGDTRVLHASSQFKQEYVRLLACEAGVAFDVVAFAIGAGTEAPFRAGGNRNALLLATAGTPVFSADDDTVFRTGTVPEVSAGVTFTSDFDPRTFRFFRGVDEALASVEWQALDAFAEHERVLGKRTVAAGRACGRSLAPAWGEISGTFLQGLMLNRGRVLLSMNSLAGDSGMGWPSRMLWLRSRSRDELTRSEDVYC